MVIYELQSNSNTCSILFRDNQVSKQSLFLPEPLNWRWQEVLIQNKDIINLENSYLLKIRILANKKYKYKFITKKPKEKEKRPLKNIIKDNNKIKEKILKIKWIVIFLPYKLKFNKI